MENEYNGKERIRRIKKRRLSDPHNFDELTNVDNYTVVRESGHDECGRKYYYHTLYWKGDNPVLINLRNDEFGIKELWDHAIECARLKK